jgi:hypothetical protein
MMCSKHDCAGSRGACHEHQTHFLNGRRLDQQS